MTEKAENLNQMPDIFDKEKYPRPNSASYRPSIIKSYEALIVKINEDFKLFFKNIVAVEYTSDEIFKKTIDDLEKALEHNRTQVNNICHERNHYENENRELKIKITNLLENHKKQNDAVTEIKNELESFYKKSFFKKIFTSPKLIRKIWEKLYH